MAKRWYVVHTYSGYENKVKTDLEHRIETYGLERAVVAITATEKPASSELEGHTTRCISVRTPAK